MFDRFDVETELRRLRFSPERRWLEILDRPRDGRLVAGDTTKRGEHRIFAPCQDARDGRMYDGCVAYDNEMSGVTEA